MVHTVISTETIKPSSPTPSHPQIYNLSLFDQVSPKVHMPSVFFYENDDQFTAQEKVVELKKSLAQSLAKYYPFAGRFPSPPATAYVDCNDEGVEFSQAQHEGRLDDFLDTQDDEKTLGQLFRDGRGMSGGLIEVQANIFRCGGIAVALSISHKVGDVGTAACFINYWAAVARSGSVDHKEVLAMDPHFLADPLVGSGEAVVVPEAVLDETEHLKSVKFVFPNSKLKDLKSKVAAAGATATRVEALTALLFKAAVAAAAANSGSFKPSALFFPLNLRRKMATPLPDTTVGNICLPVVAPIIDTAAVTHAAVIAELRKGKMQLEGIKDVQEASGMLMMMMTGLASQASNSSPVDLYGFSSLCGFPLYEADFGWGKPVRVTCPVDSKHKNAVVMADTPAGDGIEARVTLAAEVMAVFEIDGEVLEFCSN